MTPGSFIRDTDHRILQVRRVRPTGADKILECRDDVGCTCFRRASQVMPFICAPVRLVAVNGELVA